MKTATLPANTLMPDYSTGKSSLPSPKQKTQNLKAELKKEILKLVVKDFISMDNKWKRNLGCFETQTLHCKDETPGISHHLACKCGNNTVYLENSLQMFSQENLLKLLTEKSHKNH